MGADSYDFAIVDNNNLVSIHNRSNTLGYYDELYALIVHCMEKGFAGKDTASLLGLCDTPEQVMEYLDAYIPVTGSTKRICEYCR